MSNILHGLDDGTRDLVAINYSYGVLTIENSDGVRLITNNFTIEIQEFGCFVLGNVGIPGMKFPRSAAPIISSTIRNSSSWVREE